MIDTGKRLSALLERVAAKVVARHLKKDERHYVASLKLAFFGQVVLEGADRLKHMEEAFRLIELTYRAIGVKVGGPSDLLSYDTWWSFFDPEGNLVAISLFKTTQFGKKLGLIGSDGREGKTYVKNQLRNLFRLNGYYAEVSHAVERIALDAGAPVVPNEHAEAILGKPVILEEDGIHYTRNLSGVGMVTKVLVGNPNFNLKASNFQTKFSSKEEVLAHHTNFIL